MDKLYLIKTRTQICGNAKYKNYWIDENYIQDFYVVADSPQTAMDKFCENINNGYLGKITKSARQNIAPIYRDINDTATQSGYIVKMWADIEDKQICCDLWCEIFTLANFDKQ